MRIAHISDLHILDLRGLKPWHLNPKRAAGGLNLLLNRAKSHAREPVEHALREIEAQNVDHIVVTGDLTNLALDSEFEAARAIIASAGAGDRVSVIPGNHDAYTHKVVRQKRFEHFFGDWMRSDLDTSNVAPYPFVKFLGEVALIGISTSIPSAPLFAIGEVGQTQLDAIANLLEHPKIKGAFKVVAFHHHVLPPPRLKRHIEWMRRLRDADQLLRVLKTGGVQLGIHGHTHQFSLTSHIHPGAETFLHIAAAGSTSVTYHHDELKAGKFNVYDITPNAAGRAVLSRITTFLYHQQDGRFEEWKTRSFTS